MGARLIDKVAIVTGAGSGIGFATAQRYAEEGAAVICADLKGATACADRITDAGGRAVAVDVDASDLAASEAMAASAVDAFGTIDILYANAGIAGTGSALDTDPTVWDRVIAVNLTGVWYSMRAVLPTMVSAGQGSIITQASIGGIVGIPGIAPYAAAKAGVIGLTKQAAVEFGPAGVRVNAIAPGTAPTPLVTETYRERAGLGSDADAEIEEALRTTLTRYPIGRLGSVEDIASLALFLASDESSWITGGVHVIDGGMTAA